MVKWKNEAWNQTELIIFFSKRWTDNVKNETNITPIS